MEVYESLLSGTISLLYSHLQGLTAYGILKIVGVTVMIANLKNIPLIYHLRILNGIRFVLKSQRPVVKITPEHLFEPLITSSRAPLMEIDVFGHKSNSTFFADIDIAGAHFVSTIFSEAIGSFRGSTTMNGLSGKPQSAFTMPLGAVSCSFRKELKPYEAYDMWARILSWDEKWVYMVTHFVKKSSGIKPSSHMLYPQQDSDCSKDARAQENDPPATFVAASELSKVVFKDGRRTIAPKLMLELAGLYPKCECMGTKDACWTGISSEDVRNCSGDSGYGSKVFEALGCISTSALCKIERERRRGLEVATLLGKQTVLSEEFNPESCLGRHYDGVGVEGVVSTLAQLGKLSKFQLI